MGIKHLFLVIFSLVTSISFGDELRICTSDNDCTTLTVCCDLYVACNKNNLVDCKSEQEKVCAQIECAGACPDAPSAEEYENSVKCINNRCVIDPKLEDRAFACFN